MHFIAIGAGSAGDVLPFLLAAQALKARGHEVQLVSAPQFRTMVEAAGIEFIAGGSQATFDAVVNDPDVWHPRKGLQTIWRHIGPLWAEGYEILARAAKPGRTVLFGGGLALQMRLLQEKLGVKAITVHLAPASLLSAHDPPRLPFLGWIGMLPPRLVGAILSGIERRILDPMIVPDLNRFRRTIGLPPVSNVARGWMNSPDGVICAFPAWFAPPQPDWPRTAVCTPFPLQASPPGTALDTPLAEFLEAGSPPLLFTPGSAMAQGRDFFVRAVETCRVLDRRGVLVTRYADQLPSRLPPTIFHSGHVPFDLLARRVAMLVHHGGIGTLAQGLAAGKPQLLTPFSFDQPDNARRLSRLGVSDSVAPSSAPRHWAKAAAALLQDPDVGRRCREVAVRIRQEERGAEQMADRLLEFGGAA
jgi:rhamnosyltransferase subunit B